MNRTNTTMKLGLTFAAAALAATGCDRRTTFDRENAPPPEPAATVASPAPVASSAPAPATTASSPEPVSTTRTTSATLPPFEGQLDLSAQGKNPEALSYAMKGDKIRLGLSPKGGANAGVDAIVDTTTKKAYVLLNDEKRYAEIDLGKVENQAKKRLEQIDVKKTGKTSEVAGRTCEEWVIVDKAGQVHACVAKGAPWFDVDALEQRANIQLPAWVHEVVDEGYVPLRVSITDASGKALAGTQVADTSRQVDASKFDVPSDYQKTDASKLGADIKKKMP